MISWRSRGDLIFSSASHADSCVMGMGPTLAAARAQVVIGMSQLSSVILTLRARGVCALVDSLESCVVKAN
eukprot:CAMPEP_0181226038 /NCGR_PEP_ID=MMETSP1096-20121128/32039_1 /TAXON_ID=156174 ORGANISM="Chrysochromulina ericina, Strain CCMP281" /NCGR_SAMPLE_ID=MMETSP1096 /ASSEMBLY_ACC=CAM_ASM_000453 /LENGTH=70 /DNA_ID=CAMNT_0023319345 /DNA_START=339 /DNA_END=551 /DNA_ORIENTATION=-